jgi:WD40 repeat protein
MLARSLGFWYVSPLRYFLFCLLCWSLLACSGSAQEDRQTTSIKPLSQLREHSDSITSIRFDQTGKLLASAGEDKVVRIWKVDARRSLGVLKGHQMMVTSVDWAERSGEILTASADRTVRVWSADTYQERAILAKEQRAILSIASLSHGNRAVYGTYDPTDGGIARVIEVAGGKVLATLKGHTEPVYAVSCDDENHLIATGGADGRVLLWNSESFELVATVVVAKRIIVALSVLRKSHEVLAGATSGELTVINGRSGAIIRQITMEGSINGIDVSPDQTLVALAVRDGLQVMKSDTLTTLGSITPHEGSIITSIRFSPVPGMLASGGHDFDVSLWNVTSDH